uniref:Uncharacterized protein n=1 Tax=Vitis vinifera TaxID=29760 RepID=A5B5C2_VITVI|nr:hypothetical protein VITISV_007123 [Vitis vinifera]
MGSDGFKEVRNGVRGFVCVISRCAGLFSSDAWSRGYVGIFATSLGFVRCFRKPPLFHKSISQPGGDFIAKGHFRSLFRSLKVILQPNAIFAANGHFRRPFRSPFRSL